MLAAIFCVIMLKTIFIYYLTIVLYKYSTLIMYGVFKDKRVGILNWIWILYFGNRGLSQMTSCV
jgi:hypothetical protein